MAEGAVEGLPQTHAPASPALGVPHGGADGPGGGGEAGEQRSLSRISRLPGKGAPCGWAGQGRPGLGA